jgi:predicted DNA-binding transcriptional regulator AlpA
MTTATLKTLGPDELATLLHRSVSTIKTDCRRRPQTLPPRLRIPGSTRLMWLEADVLDWLEQHRAKSK